MIEMKAPIAAVIIDPITLEIVGKGVDTSHNGIPVSHAVMNCIEDYSKSEHIKDGYICTDLWLLTTREPCPMYFSFDFDQLRNFYICSIKVCDGCDTLSIWMCNLWSTKC